MHFRTVWIHSYVRGIMRKFSSAKHDADVALLQAVLELAVQLALLGPLGMLLAELRASLPLWLLGRGGQPLYGADFPLAGVVLAPLVRCAAASAQCVSSSQVSHGSVLSAALLVDAHLAVAVVVVLVDTRPAVAAAVLVDARPTR